MPGVLPLIERLPSIYRPEPDDGSLVSGFLGSVAAELDNARAEAGMVLPAHWFRHADRAAFDPWFTRRRERAGLPALAPTDLVDYSDAQEFLIAVHDTNDELTEFLRDQLAAPVRTALDAWDGLSAPPTQLQRQVLDALSRIVRGPLIYNEERFEGITLSAALLARAQANPPGAERTAVNTELLLEAFPDSLRRATLDLIWVRDLGRLAASVPLVPWREPVALRETVESFRIRLGRMIALYRQGLGTVGALRSVVEATLPIDASLPAELRDLPFSVEEFTPLLMAQVAAPTNGPPDNLVGPLMRWGITNPGISAAAPTIFITGLTPGAGVAATEQPMVELFELSSGARPRIAIGYADTIAPDATLRLRPAYSIWTIGADGLQRADSLPTDDAGADPSEPGASADVADAPDDIVAIFATSNSMLWAAADGGTQLSRFDGTAWTDVATGLATIQCFTEHNATLLIGTNDGLLRTPLLPAEGDDDTPVAVSGFDDIDVRCITPATPSSEYWIGTDEGALHWDGASAPEAVALGGSASVSMAVNTIHLDPGGAIHFGGPLGVFEFQPARDAWFWYSGGAFTEQSPEWLPFASTPTGTPADTRVFLPEVRAIYRGPDASLCT